MREFDVKANGEYILRDYDVVREAGGTNRAVIAEIKDVKSDENSNIVLQRQLGGPVGRNHIGFRLGDQRTAEDPDERQQEKQR